MGRHKVLFEKEAIQDLDDLPTHIARRIVEKIEWYSTQEDPLVFASTLHDSQLGMFRYRIGQYRAIFDVEKGVIIIRIIGHRSTIYQ